jgi:hypothetical protein
MNYLETVNIYTYVGYFYDEHAGHVVDFYLPESFSISAILKILLIQMLIGGLTFKTPALKEQQFRLCWIIGFALEKLNSPRN